MIILYYYTNIIYFPTITIIIRSVTQKDGKYYPQIFLDDCFYEV